MKAPSATPVFTMFICSGGGARFCGGMMIFTRPWVTRSMSFSQG